MNVGTFIQSVQIRDHKRTRSDDYMCDHDSLREREREGSSSDSLKGIVESELYSPRREYVDLNL